MKTWYGIALVALLVSGSESALAYNTYYWQMYDYPGRSDCWSDDPNETFYRWWGNWNFTCTKDPERDTWYSCDYHSWPGPRGVQWASCPRDPDTDEFMFFVDALDACVSNPPPPPTVVCRADDIPCITGPNADVDPGSTLGPSCPKAGNPCNPATGNKYQREVDLQLPSGLTFVRYYNSAQARRTSVGLNWHHSYSYGIESDGAEALVQRPDGRLYTYTLDGGVWGGNPDVDATLTQTAGGWTYTLGDGAQEVYDDTGRLLSLSDRLGRITTPGYDGDGRLITVTGPFGRTLSLAYDGEGRIQSVTDPAGQAYTYAYDDAGRLVSVTDPNGGVRTYHYERDDYPQLLTGITDEAGHRYATWSYDEHGWATTSEHAGGAEQVQLDYGDDGSTTVTDSAGLTRTYRFEVIQGVPRVTEIVTDLPQ